MDGGAGAHSRSSTLQSINGPRRVGALVKSASHHTTLGTSQVQSKYESPPASSFPRAKLKPDDKANPMLGEAHLRHVLQKDTPSPGDYAVLPNVLATRSYSSSTMATRPTLSKQRAPVSHTFSKTPRFGYVERNIRKTATPGPGAYVN